LARRPLAAGYLGSLGGNILQIVIVAVIAWIIGVAAYFATFLFVYGERPTWSGDTKAVLFWSALTFSVLFFVLYMPVLRGIKRILRGVRSLWPFPLAAGGLGVAPTAVIAFLNGGDARSLLSSEAVLFYVMFAAAGLVVGVGFAVVNRNASPGT
jgi:hypothetical protein